MNLRHAAALALFLCGLPTTLSAQTMPDTFTSPNGVFRFNSGALIRCTEEAQRGVWDPWKYCFTYIPICDAALVCFAYPLAFERFGVAVAFSVSEITKATTEKECLSRSPDWTHDPPENGEPVTINNARFQLFHTSDLGTGHVAAGREYRTFHEGKCYELSIRSTWSDHGADDEPAKDITRKDWEKLNAPLDRALNSFSFLK
jgi:hypothetical protein